MNSEQGELVKFDAAKRAIAEAKGTDELLAIIDYAKLMKAAARVANDRSMEADAVEIRMRAVRRLGQVMEAQRATVGLNQGAVPGKTGSKGHPVLDTRPTLAQIGIGKRLAHEARGIASAPEVEFRRRVEETQKVVTGAIDKATRAAIKKGRRAERLSELAGKAAALPGERFVVAVLDPPHREEPWSRDTGLNKAPDNHYPTLTQEEIAERMPPLMADAVVYYWTTVSMMRSSIEILEGWGLTYKSNMIWVKERQGKRLGLGRWSRVDHEIMLIYTQGNPPAPADESKIRSVLFGPPRAHSEKPDEFYDMLRENYPDPLPKMEMYARKPHEGFVPWGNEVE